MPRYRHVIRLGGYDLPGHLARTLCGRFVAYGRQPNVPRGDARFCARSHALDEPSDLPAPTNHTARPKEQSAYV